MGTRSFVSRPVNKGRAERRDAAVLHGHAPTGVSLRACLNKNEILDHFTSVDPVSTFGLRDHPVKTLP